MGDFHQIGMSLLAEEELPYSAVGDVVGHWVYIVFTIAVILGILSVAKKGFGERVFKKPLSGAAEQLYLFIENMCVGTVGPHGRKYIPMMVTFWLVIFFGNVIALFFPFSPTASLSFNLGMALTAIGYVQFEGMKSNGILGHFSHFSGPRLTGFMVIISAMIFVIEIISEVMKNVSLSLRLYGNINGGHQAVEAMNHLGGSWVPVGEFLLPIKILTCLVQAMIFTLLTCVYLSLVTHHEEEHHEEAHGATPAHAH